MNAQQKYVERGEKMKNEFKEGLINDETFSDKELLFDDWEVRNPTFYSRERKEYVIFLLWFSLCIIFAFVVSFFYVEVLLFLFLFIISFHYFFSSYSISTSKNQKLSHSNI